MYASRTSDFFLIIRMILDRIGLQSLLLPLQIVCLLLRGEKKAPAWPRDAQDLVRSLVTQSFPSPHYHDSLDITWRLKWKKNITIWWVVSCNVRMLVNLLMAVITDGGSFSALRHLADHSQDESTSRSGSWYLKVGILRLLPANFNYMNPKRTRMIQGCNYGKILPKLNNFWASKW